MRERKGVTRSGSGTQAPESEVGTRGTRLATRDWNPGCWMRESKIAILSILGSLVLECRSWWKWGHEGATRTQGVRRLGHH